MVIDGRSIGSTPQMNVALSELPKFTCLPEPGEHHRNIIQDMVSALQHGTPLACNGREGRKSLAILDAIYRSAREGASVTPR